MPAAGTKKLELDSGEVVYLPADDVETTKAIDLLLEIEARHKADAVRLKEVKAFLIERAEQRVGGTERSVKLRAASGNAALVTFPVKLKIEGEDAERLKTRLKDAGYAKIFARLFTERHTYSVKAAWQKFREQRQAPELEALKPEIQGVISAEAMSPRVKPISGIDEKAKKLGLGSAA